MRRPTPPGTPSRSSRYIMPGRAGGLAVWSLTVGAGVLLLGLVLYAVGVHRVASPGPVAAVHAAIDTRCVACHQPGKSVADLRCERCHDPIDARRFESQAHGAIGGGAAAAAHVAPVECAVCHGEHEGRAQDLSRVVDERCVSCHRFGSFRSHPEFAVVRAKAEPNPGIDFSHEIHLREVAKLGGDRCQACHQATPDQRGFEPIAFDTHCATCHVKDRALTLNGTDMLKSNPTPANVLLASTPEAPAPAMTAPDERGRVTLERFSHRDPWVLATAARLTRTMASPVLAMERARLAERIAQLSAIADAVPMATLGDADIARWLTSVEGEVAAMDRRIAAGPSAPADAAAALGGVAGVVDPALATLTSQLGGTAARAADPNAVGPADAQQFEARRQELQQLVDAVAARTTGPLAARAADLKTRLAELKAGGAPAAAVDANGLGDHLAVVSAALRAVEAAASEAGAADVRVLGDEVRQQIAGGGDARTRAAERARLLALLDTMSARGTPALRARISELRAAVLAAPDPADGLRARRAGKARLLERLALERALRSDGGPAPVDAIANAERTSAARELAALRARLAILDRDQSTAAGVDAARGKVALKGLMGACLSCHRLNEDETALRPVSAGRAMLTAATFTHKPHLLQAKCETCHASITTSKSATDISVPAVAACQSCHNASQARADCASCHVYHPRSAAEMVLASSR